MKNQPLRCGVEQDELVVRIGINTLAWAAKKKNGGPLSGAFKVTSPAEFAFDVARGLSHEDELGNTMLCDVLDQAIQFAADRGSTGLSYPKYKK